MKKNSKADIYSDLGMFIASTVCNDRGVIVFLGDDISKLTDVPGRSCKEYFATMKNIASMKMLTQPLPPQLIILHAFHAM